MERLHCFLVKHKAFQFDTEEGARGFSLYAERGCWKSVFNRLIIDRKMFVHGKCKIYIHFSINILRCTSRYKIALSKFIAGFVITKIVERTLRNLKARKTEEEEIVHLFWEKISGPVSLLL